MIVTRLILKNWRNFKHVDVVLGDRVFLVGPNAAGKSNFLEVFRFLRDIAKAEGGGLQEALRQLGGLRKIRCLAAKGKPNVEIEVHLGEAGKPVPLWKYAIGLEQKGGESEPPRLVHERIERRDGWKKVRPDEDDKRDPERLQQTYLETTFENAEFRDVAKFFDGVTYLHDFVQRVLRRERLDRGEDLRLLVPDGIGFERDGRLHGRQRHKLEKMIRDHVAQRTGLVVVAATLFDA